MTDVLIRNVPDDQLARLDAHAARLGLSRGSICAGRSPRMQHAEREA